MGAHLLAAIDVGLLNGALELLISGTIQVVERAGGSQLVERGLSSLSMLPLRPVFNRTMIPNVVKVRIEVIDVRVVMFLTTTQLSLHPYYGKW